MDFAKTKVKYKNNKTFIKNRLHDGFYKCDTIWKKKLFFCFGQNWESMNSLIEAREKGSKKVKKGQKNGLCQMKNWII